MCGSSPGSSNTHALWFKLIGDGEYLTASLCNDHAIPWGITPHSAGILMSVYKESAAMIYNA